MAAKMRFKNLNLWVFPKMEIKSKAWYKAAFYRFKNLNERDTSWDTQDSIAGIDRIRTNGGQAFNWLKNKDNSIKLNFNKKLMGIGKTIAYVISTA